MIARKMLDRVEAELLAAITGPALPKPRQTALVMRSGWFQPAELDDNGNVIEPCRKCGPVLLCADHMAIIT